MPERDILKSGLRIGAHYPGQTADLLAGNGIAFMRHRRRALLLFAKKFLNFTHFGSLQVADLSRHHVERRRDHCQCRQIVRMAIALDDLGGNIRGPKTQMAQIFSSISGVRCAKMPTAPDNLPTRISSAAAAKRAMLRCVSEYQLASLNPKVMGSAWMP